MRGFTPNKLPQQGYRMPQKQGGESSGSKGRRETSGIYPTKDIEINNVRGHRKSASTQPRQSNMGEIPPALQMAMKVTRHSGKERGWEFLRAVSPYLTEQERSSIRNMLEGSQGGQRRNTDDGQRQSHKESKPYENRSYQRGADEYDSRPGPEVNNQAYENDSYRRPPPNNSSNPMEMMNMLNQFMNMTGNRGRGGQSTQTQQSVPVNNAGGPANTGNPGNRNPSGNSGNRNPLNNIGSMLNMMSGMMGTGSGNNSQGGQNMGNMGNMGQLLNALRMMNQMNPGGF